MKNWGQVWLLEFQEITMVQFGQFGWFYAWQIHWFQIGSFNTLCHALCYISTPLIHQEHAPPLAKPFSHMFTHKLTHAVSCLILASLSCRNSTCFSIQNEHMHAFLPCVKHSPFQKPNFPIITHTNIPYFTFVEIQSWIWIRKLFHALPLSVVFKKSEIHSLP